VAAVALAFLAQMTASGDTANAWSGGYHPGTAADVGSQPLHVDG